MPTRISQPTKQRQRNSHKRHVSSTFHVGRGPQALEKGQDPSSYTTTQRNFGTDRKQLENWQSLCREADLLAIENATRYASHEWLSFFPFTDLKGYFQKYTSTPSARGWSIYLHLPNLRHCCHYRGRHGIYVAECQRLP